MFKYFIKTARKPRIGIVLGKYPVTSEPFITSFLNHLSDYQIILYANINTSYNKNKSWFIKPYLNSLPGTRFLPAWLLSILSFVIYLRRFIILRGRGISTKQLIADAPIWTTTNLDILHFPFGNLVFGREQYAEILNAKMTISFRGSDINVYPINHSRTYSSIWPFVHAVHCNSKELEAKLRQHSLPLSIPVAIIPAALRVDFSKTVVKNSPEEYPYKLTKNPLTIITLGRLHWIKDYPLALRTMAQLKESGIIFKYYILGEGSEREQIVFLRKELGLENEVILAGRVSEIDVQHFFSRAHLYIQTSYAEGFSNACIEAQAFGVPCIVPAISGMDVCIEHLKTGIIVEDRNESSFVQAIKYIANNPEQFDKEYINHRVKTLFSLDKQKDAWQQFFRQFESDI